MYNPNGGLVSMAARDYYYQEYATEEEREQMDENRKIDTIVGIITLILFIIFLGSYLL